MLLPLFASPLETLTEKRFWRNLALLAITATAALRLLYLAWDCPLDLAPDEAHYWDWSRHLDWSYYSKGPLVAYLIRGSCQLAGSLSQGQTGTEMLAVRLPAGLCGSLLLVSLYVLTVQVYQRRRLAGLVVLGALTLPIVSAGSTLMTIDAPYTCCWGWALVLGYQAACKRANWAWPILGLVVGLGILAKYTMVLWLPSFALFLLTTPSFRRHLFRPGFWVMTAFAGFCCVPILYWNWQHEWVTFRHVGGQAGLQGEAGGWRWLGPLEYVGTQAALLLVFWFSAWLAAMVAHRPWQEPDTGTRYLWWMSAPMFLVFLFFSLKTPEEPNWPVTAYLSGLVLSMAWLEVRLRSARSWFRRLTWAGLATAVLLGLAITVLMHYPRSLQPALLPLSGPVSAERPLPLRRFDPTCRLRGWRTLAQAVDRLREQLRDEGVEPILAAASWTLPGELGFYCAGHPDVYSLGLAQGDRHSQYDLWRPNPLWDREAFLGRTFIFVGDLGPTLRAAFSRVEPSTVITHEEREQPIARWAVTVCRDFRGLGDPPARLTQRRF